MKKKLLTIWMTTLMAITTCLGVVACDDGGDPPAEPEKLATVTVTIEGNKAVWGEVKNAYGYAYVINGGKEQKTNVREITLKDKDTIRVKALGDGVNYLDGNYCEQKICNIVLEKLPKVTLQMVGNKVTWEEIGGAVAYTYQINGGAEVTTTARSVRLADGDSIKVKAKGDSISYADGNYSEVKKYVAPTMPEYTTLLIEKTIDEGDTLTLSQIALPTGFAWKDSSTAVEADGYYGATYAEAGKTAVDANIYIDLTITPAPQPEPEPEPEPEPTPEPSVPEYTTIVVAKTIEEGTTFVLSEIALPTGFAWKNPTAVVSDGGYYEATYTEEGKTPADAQVYIDLTITPAPVVPEPTPTVPEYTTIVVTKTINEGDTLCLNQIDLPSGFEWQVPGGVVTESGYYAATYTDANDTVEARVYIDLTITPAPQPEPEPEPEPEPTPDPTVPEYTTVVVTYTIDEGDTLCLNQIALPQGFAWQVPGGVVTESGYYAATYTDANDTVNAQVYVDLTVIPTPVEPTPETPAYTTIVVEKRVKKGETFTLSKVTLPENFTWAVPSTVVTASGYQDAYYKSTIAARVYISLTVEEAELVKLGNVSVTLKGHTASWAEVANASRYAYQINAGEVVETTLRSITLNVGDAIRVKAIGDGVNYADGDYSKIYTHNSIYDGEIYDEAVVTINGLESLSDASVVGASSTVIDPYRRSQGNGSFNITYSQTATINIPMKRNGVTLSEEKLQLFSELRLSFFISGDYLWNDTVIQQAASIKIGNKEYKPKDCKPGWNTFSISVSDFLASKAYDGTFTAVISRPQSGSYWICVDNLQGVYPEKLNLGNVMVFGDSYSTYQGYIRDPRFFYYADSPVSQTDVNDVSQTWWGQVIANTDSSLLMNDSISGSTVSATTYTAKWDSSPQDCFVERIDMLVNEGYFTKNQVDTVFMFGGTNDSWGGNALGSAKYSGWTKSDLEQVLPAYCYFISKILQNSSTAKVVVVLNTYENMNDPIIPSYRKDPLDYQTAIINAVKGFSEYGTRIQIVALTNNEHNNPDTSIGVHPTIVGMGAIKDQILNVLYERKHLPMSKWTAIGHVSAGTPTTTVLQNFSAAPTKWDMYNFNVASDSKSQDGNGSWKVTPVTAGSDGYVVGHVINSLSGYSTIKVSIYADAAAAGTKIYMDTGKTILLGTLAAGANTLSIAASKVKINHNDGSSNHIRLVFALPSGAAIYLDSISAVS